jgi:hypothetical protein
MELLRFQAILSQESSPNGRLRSLKWYINSLTSHDFLLAATIVCLDLYYGKQACEDSPGTSDIYTWGLDRQEDMIEALQKSRDIWQELRDISMDAYKASEMISVMLVKLKSKEQPSTQNPFSFQSNPDNPFAPQQDDHKLEQNAAMTLGMMSGNVMAPNAFDPNPSINLSNGQGLPVPAMDQGVVSAPSPFSLFGPTAMMETPPANLDWVCFHFSWMLISNHSY